MLTSYNAVFLNRATCFKIFSNERANVYPVRVLFLYKELYALQRSEWNFLILPSMSDVFIRRATCFKTVSKKFLIFKQSECCLYKRSYKFFNGL
jgi:hypothetical protein